MPDQLRLFLVDPAQSREPEPRLPDADARTLALDIRQSWIVEAPAGSGKTGLLIQRFLRLLADPAVHSPEQVLAITFTRKATAEMRDRVLAQLQSAASGRPPENEFDHATRPFAEVVLHRDQARDASLRWSLLDNPRRLNIRTIDSVCSEIAGLLPVLSGSGGRRSPAEDANPLYALAARRTLLQLGGPDPALHDALALVLLHRDGSLANCERLLTQMLELRDQWGPLVPQGRRLDDAELDATVLPRLERALDEIIRPVLTELVAMIPAPLLSRLTTAAAEMAHLESYDEAPSPIAVCAGRYHSPRARSEDVDHWLALVHLLVTAGPEWRKRYQPNHLKFKLGKVEQGYLQALVDESRQIPGLLDAIDKLRKLPPAIYPAEQWQVAKALFRVLQHALVELKLVFAERGQCDYAEVALAARTALDPAESNPTAALDLDSPLEAALGIRLQHLLVDEMQDTSSLQYELIQALTRRWDGHSQTVFLVGDPKQSIYLFRQARVERFLRTMRTGLLGDLSLGVLRLTANFRSEPSLVAAFNDDFQSIFPALSAAQPDDVPFVPAVAARRVPHPSGPLAMGGTATPPGVPSNAASRNGWEEQSPRAPSIAASSDGWESNTARIWHPKVLPYEPDKTQAALNLRRQRRSDARQIRAIVDDWRSRPLPEGRTSPWKIAVLCRSRNHLDEIVALLKQDPAIPFRAVDVDPLRDRPEVQDLVALTRALLHPADRVAWLAVLHAPWCGLSLTELLLLTGQDDPAFAEHSVPRLLNERGHLLPDEACQRLQRIWPFLEAALHSRARLSAPQLVERTWRSLGGDSWLDPAQLANATRYLQLLDQLEEEAAGPGGTVHIDLALLERRLDKLFAAPIVHPDAVDLLTIHKAKGLEWDVVIVPGLERTPAFSPTRFLNWVELDSSGEDSAHILLAPISGKGEDSDALGKWIRSVHTARETAEYKRLFYVACTRAREELHLFAAPATSVKGAITRKPSSLLAAAWPAAASRFAAALQQNDADGDAATEPFIVPALAADAPVPDDTSPAFNARTEDSDDIQAASLDDLEAASITVIDDDSLFAALPDRTAPLRRLPLAFDPAARLANPAPLPHGNPSTDVPTPQFDRPEGSLAARALGTAVHLFLEKLTAAIACGELPSALLAALPSWTPQINAILRSEGLAAAEVNRLAPRVLSALKNTLEDPSGRWLLSAHPGAATEYALTAWASDRSNIRIDRIFRAGPEPAAPGTTHLWIVDYKTSTPRAGELDTFLTSEREKYAPQLEAYAAVLQQTALAEAEGKPAIRLALYYPMLPKLIWWQPA